jgi:hypothetical protein
MRFIELHWLGWVQQSSVKAQLSWEELGKGMVLRCDQMHCEGIVMNSSEMQRQSSVNLRFA